MLKVKDALVAAILFVIMAGISYLGGNKLESDALKNGVWFEADINRVYQNLTDRDSNHYRTKVHPLYSLFTAPVVHGLYKLGIDKETAVKIFIAVAAGLWLVLFYSILRLLRFFVFDSILFSLLLLSTASAIFWTTVPETYVFGSFTMLLVLAFMVYTENRYFTAPYYIVISALSLSITITNWMSGLIATFANNSIRKSVQISINAFFIVTILWGIQKWFFGTAEFFLVLEEEPWYMLNKESGSIVDKLCVFFLHAVVMPQVQILPNHWGGTWPYLSIQFSAIGSTGFIGWLSSIIWLFVFSVGVISAWKNPKYFKLKLVLFGTLLGQFLLHLVYGDETFLYVLHWAPYLVLVAAFGLSSSLRPVVLTLVTLLTVGLGWNNVNQFQRISTELAKGETGIPGSERYNLISAIKGNPQADWPRGEGHVLLANTGSRLEQKGYHEPGAAFSPGFGSFGVSILLFDKEGNLRHSSNSIPMQQIQQSLNAKNNSITTKTSWFTCTWKILPTNEWQLDLSTTSELIPVIKISSSGPSGSPINNLSWNDNRLHVNDKFQVVFQDMPESIMVMDEKTPPMLPTQVFSSDEVDSYVADDGFVQALFRISGNENFTITIQSDENTAATKDQASYIAEHELIIDLPDKRFKESLEAQLFHIKAGLIGNETRPGDPGNYDLKWLRDGAYSLVALVRSGEYSLAKKLSSHYLNQDFFGGFGSEADSPGLALWALEEISYRLNDPEYDKSIWHHIQRKADIVIEMMHAKQAVRKPFSGALVPRLRNKKYPELTLIADPAEQGLIVGKMDGHRPVFYVNAVSYLGLRSAASFAERLGLMNDADVYNQLANKIRESWRHAINTHPDRFNQRTLISALWPSWIAKGNEETIAQLLQTSWNQRRDNLGNFVSTPIWTYFDIAEAHQWLLLGNQEKVWNTLDWFWANQASPGLYTWWEGEGEENTFGLWQTARGWVKPLHVTPHYWSASEMALLQLDMLAYETVIDDVPTIVIGSGIPESWMGYPISVSNLSLMNGLISWQWDGKDIEIKWAGEKGISFLLGPSFPTDAQIINQLE